MANDASGSRARAVERVLSEFERLLRQFIPYRLWSQLIKDSYRWLTAAVGALYKLHQFNTFKI